MGADPFVSLGFYLHIWAAFVGPFEPAVRAMVGQLSTYVSPIYRTSVAVFLVAYLLMNALRNNAQATNNLFPLMFKAAVLDAFISFPDQYYGLVGNLALNSIPDGISQAMARAVGTAPVTANAFDVINGKSFAVGVAAAESGSWASLKVIPLALGVLFYWAASGLSIFFSFVYWALAHVITTILVAVGIIFIPLRLFPELARFFNGWLAALVSAVLTKIFAVTVLAMLVHLETGLVNRLRGNLGASGTIMNASGVWGVLAALLLMVFVFLFVAVVLLFLTRFAQAIAGGVYFNAGEIARLASGAANGAAGLMGGGARSAGGGARAGAGGGGGYGGGGATAAGPQPAASFGFQRSVGSAR